MITYQLTDFDTVVRNDGAIIPTDPANSDFACYLDWVEAGGVADPAPVVVPAPIRVITPREFRQRFTNDERAAITLAASVALAAGDPTLQVWLDDLSASQVVELDHPEVAAGLDGLVVAGLISTERRAAILA